MDRLDHLSDRELIRFYRGELSASESRRVVRHLLSGCSSCRDRSAGRWRHDVAEKRDPETDRFDEIFERAARGALSLGSAILDERKAAPALLSELLRHPVERQNLLVANSLRFRSYGLVEELLETAFEVGFNDPRAAIDRAEVAVAMADRLSTSTYGERLVDDLRARAWGTLGNAQRIASRLLAAEDSIQRGFELAGRGTGDPSEQARLLSFLASLRAEQHRFDDALQIHRKMERIYKILGDRHMQGRTANQMAFVLRVQGDFAGSIEHSKRALADLDPARDRRLVLLARQGQAHAQLEIGELEQASEECLFLRRSWTELGDDLSALRCDWLLGRIRHRQKRLDLAERIFRRVRDRFIQLEIPYDAALANLDLAEVLFDQGKTVEVGQRLAEAIPLFRGLGIHREAIAALSFLKQATELEQVTTGLIRATARFVKETKKNPDVRFRSQALTKDS